MAPTTTLEQDWLAAIQREEQDSLRPEHRSAEPEVVAALSAAATTAAPKLNFPPKSQFLRDPGKPKPYGFSPSPAFSSNVQQRQQMSPAASASATASHPSSSAGIKLQLEIKKSREDRKTLYSSSRVFRFQ